MIVFKFVHTFFLPILHAQILAARSTLTCTVMYNTHTHTHTQDLESKSLVDTIDVDGFALGGPTECMSLAWSSDGQTLFAGFTDNIIRVYDVEG